MPEHLFWWNSLELGLGVHFQKILKTGSQKWCRSTRFLKNVSTWWSKNHNEILWIPGYEQWDAQIIGRYLSTYDLYVIWLKEIFFPGLLFCVLPSSEILPIRRWNNTKWTVCRFVHQARRLYGCKGYDWKYSYALYLCITAIVSIWAIILQIGIISRFLLWWIHFQQFHCIMYPRTLFLGQGNSQCVVILPIRLVPPLVLVLIFFNS